MINNPFKDDDNMWLVFSNGFSAKLLGSKNIKLAMFQLAILNLGPRHGHPRMYWAPFFFNFFFLGGRVVLSYIILCINLKKNVQISCVSLGKQK